MEPVNTCQGSQNTLKHNSYSLTKYSVCGVCTDKQATEIQNLYKTNYWPVHPLRLLNPLQAQWLL